MNVEIGTVAAQFLFWEYLFQIFSIDSLQGIVHIWSNLDYFTMYSTAYVSGKGSIIQISISEYLYLKH